MMKYEFNQITQQATCLTVDQRVSNTALDPAFCAMSAKNEHRAFLLSLTSYFTAMNISVTLLIFSYTAS